jgi:hypothetical protein
VDLRDPFDGRRKSDRLEALVQQNRHDGELMELLGQLVDD